MPIIRDGNNRVDEYETLPPAAVPSGPIERSRVSEARMADFAAERARMAEKAARTREVPIHVFRPNAAQRAAAKVKEDPVSAEHHDAGTNRVRQQVAEGAKAAVEGSPAGPPAQSRRYPLPRDHAARRAAILEALRATPTVKAAAVLLGVTETRVGQILREIRLAGEMPADLDAAIKSRSANAAAKLTGKVPLAPPLIDPAGLTAAEHRRAVAEAAQDVSAIRQSNPEDRIRAAVTELEAATQEYERNNPDPDSTSQGPEAGAPATAATTSEPPVPEPAEVASTPPGPASHGWDGAMQDPAFVAALEEGLADVAAGRIRPLVDVPAAEAGGGPEPVAEPVAEREPAETTLSLTLDVAALARCMDSWQTYQISAFFDGLTKLAMALR